MAHSSGGSGTPTGDVSLIAATGPSISGQTGVDGFTLTNGSIAAGSTTNLLVGGTYNVKAHYEGDPTFLGSDSTTVSVTVNPEGSATSFVCDPAGTILSGCALTISPTTLQFVALSNGGSIPYGDMVYLHAAVAGTSGFGIPTGTVSIKDNSVAVAGSPFALSSDGSAVTPDGLLTLPAGSTSLVATYNHDASFNTSTSAALTFTITKATTATSVSANPTTIPAGGTSTLTATLTLGTANLPSFGNAPGATVSFFSNGTLLGSAPVTGTAGSGNPITGAFVNATGTASLTTTAGALATGSDTITAVYNGDSNYAASPASNGITVTVQAPDFSLSAPQITVSQGSSTPVTITVTALGNFNGVVSGFSCSGLPAETSCGAPSPATVTGAGTTSITITTAGLGAQRHRAANENRRTGWIAIAMLPLFGVCLIGITKRPWFTVVAFMILGVLLLPACGGGGGGGVTNNPVPSISSLSPTQQAAGSQSQTLTVNGSGFISGSSVTYNGTAHTASVASGSQLTISLTASDLLTTGQFPVVVTNPSPGGGASSAMNFNVVTGTPTGTFPVTVTATSGVAPNQTTHTATFNLVVQ